MNLKKETIFVNSLLMLEISGVLINRKLHSCDQESFCHPANEISQCGVMN